MKLFKENPIVGLATGSTTGNAVATPAVVAAACVISAIVCPIIVSYVFKISEKKKAKKSISSAA
ncbi:hypothetical protein V7068_12480 [Bacillus sp. JJ634]